ncbi:DNA glycosylase AlkZ-like family protein [Actinoplanes solisilvae]|uniref:DNA glycosylase AlkZ-like family protein n=1 Tax=Actinoplanes solisilvae TaxID=2486853 RepID=UPI000FDBDCEF|nr:crosslink repair DNA glycosylase YcaQ family protein [Actinoplanes solisilvae]
MSGELTLSRAQARRIAVRAQLLDAHRPADLFDVVSQLGFLQYDQTAAVAPNADLVAWSRLGSSYRSSELTEGLADRTYVELSGMIRPMDDIPLFRAEMAAHSARDSQFGSPRAHHWVDANDRFRQNVLALLDVDGPLPQSDIPDTSQVPWGSSGWNNNRNVGTMLECLVVRGEIAVADHDGRERMYDLAHRVYPSEVVPLETALRLRAERRLRATGITRQRTTTRRDPATRGAPATDRGPATSPGPATDRDPAGVGVPARIEGVRGRWLVDPDQLDRAFEGRTALISPLDRLIFDRKRMADLFEFDYNLEMYKPPAQRRWGYFALPILENDRLIGKLDATADRKRGVLRVDAIHEDAPFSRSTSAAVHREIQDLARWLHLGLDLPA